MPNVPLNSHIKVELDYLRDSILVPKESCLQAKLYTVRRPDIACVWISHWRITAHTGIFSTVLFLCPCVLSMAPPCLISLPADLPPCLFLVHEPAWMGFP